MSRLRKKGSQDKDEDRKCISEKRLSHDAKGKTFVRCQRHVVEKGRGDQMKGECCLGGVFLGFLGFVGWWFCWGFLWCFVVVGFFFWVGSGRAGIVVRRGRLDGRSVDSDRGMRVPKGKAQGAPRNWAQGGQVTPPPSRRGVGDTHRGDRSLR